MKKAPIAVALVLVLGLFAAAFSLAPAIAQYATTNTSNNSNSAGNETTTGNSIGTNGTSQANTTQAATFTAKGSIASLIFDMGEVATTSTANATTSNETSVTANGTVSGNASNSLGANATSSINATDSSNRTATASTSQMGLSNKQTEKPFIVSGDWNLSVKNGKVNDFVVNFTMVHVDGTNRHTHELTHFVSSNDTTIRVNSSGTTFIFGTVDVKVNGTQKWTGVDALITIVKHNVVTLSVSSEQTKNHFHGEPIYGVVDSLKDQNGIELVQSGDTKTASDATGDNSTSGNPLSGFVGNVTKGIRNLTSGGK